MPKRLNHMQPYMFIIIQCCNHQSQSTINGPRNDKNDKNIA